LLENIFPDLYDFIKYSFFTIFFFAVPRKKNSKKTIFYKKKIKRLNLNNFSLNKIHLTLNSKNKFFLHDIKNVT
jgi:hypothetical protein